ncbi:NAD(P)/FAD-dependent oxidoreductase [Gordonia sp. zg691]|uniref:NAD(P)/FAD-dependent oxidoreductase n=1 Tax=Gordonia jinghuaiqii TaxID=2758710 RepID=A0A7D7R0T6_9ACTN|nr:NAD(P)/FAD-dependent oxidoreductase [Gordonia jinghuaiqii]MBD0861654.1 NAD(P)/FAD-dependent oxidoreductase [Gordonia jinghuaiqii]MCR5977547.1 FAD-binding protein [Gordonia jinghuaiqii]QMT02231.1 NAD(P)/FAD-dependent oxidoreductase [Gordonia jinghuaiqii]
MTALDSRETSTTTTDYDVAIVGGGAAGLSAATVLARSLRKVVVIDAGQPRNGPAAGAHNVLGQEGIAPAELLARGRAEATGYGAEIRSGTVVDARRDPDEEADRFTLGLAGGETVSARRLILATGLVDELPEIPGVAELWGGDVLHCPYCHGYEVRGTRIAVIATRPMSAHQALMFRQLSDQVTVIAHDPDALSDEDRAHFDAVGIDVVDQPVERVRTRGETTPSLDGVLLTDGTVHDADAVVVSPRFAVRGDLYLQLGGTLTDGPMGGSIETGPMGETELPGVWAVGNSTTVHAMVTVAMGEGVSAGAAANASLVSAELEAKVAALA